MWRSQGFHPVVHEDAPPRGETLAAPPGASYGARLQDIFDCLEQARVTDAPLSTTNKVRLGNIEAMKFFSSDRHFPGYAKVDRFFRPTRTGDLRLSMINADRARAFWAAGIFEGLSEEEKSQFAERYLVCLLDRGYGLSPVGGADKVLK